MIIAWYGSVDQIPSGWLLCDGSNSTPDLRDRFIVGAGIAYNLDDLGGEAFHQLTIAEMPSHKHGTVGGEDGKIYAYPWGIFNGGGFLGHSGGSDVNNPSPNSSSTGGNLPHENRPPYYALYFIMKK